MHSSYMALMTMMDKLIQSRENNEYVIGIFFDFSRAFDTVDHTILLSKLHHYGIRGNALNWFSSHLSGRKQYVTYNGISSGTKTIMECHKVLFLVLYFFSYILMIYAQSVNLQPLFYLLMIQICFPAVQTCQQWQTISIMNWNRSRCG